MGGIPLEGGGPFLREREGLSGGESGGSKPQPGRGAPSLIQQEEQGGACMSASSLVISPA